MILLTSLQSNVLDKKSQHKIYLDLFDKINLKIIF